MSYKNPIRSDDPEAITKLQAQVDSCTALQVKMREANKIVRLTIKKDNTPEGREAAGILLVELGIKSPSLLFEPDFMGRVGFASYELTNNNANIRRMEARIEELRAAPTVTREEQHGDITVVENVEMNRVQLLFDDKPPAEVRSLLKSYGFRWAPSQTAWQRHLNANGLSATRQVIARIEAVAA